MEDSEKGISVLEDKTIESNQCLQLKENRVKNKTKKERKWTELQGPVAL